jgi:hypothetical protein
MDKGDLCAAKIIQVHLASDLRSHPFSRNLIFFIGE